MGRNLVKGICILCRIAPSSVRLKPCLCKCLCHDCFRDYVLVGNRRECPVCQGQLATWQEPPPPMAAPQAVGTVSIWMVQIVILTICILGIMLSVILVGFATHDSPKTNPERTECTGAVCKGDLAPEGWAGPEGVYPGQGIVIAGGNQRIEIDNR